MGKTVTALLKFKIIKHYSHFSLDCSSVFHPGITAVFGPSGSGKTTLINCIAGLVTPDSGEVIIQGNTVYSSDNHVTIPAYKRRIGYVFQNTALFPHLNVLKNITYGYKLTPMELRKIDLDQLIRLFQTSHLLDRNIQSLSGGERQRVALTRALATSPKVVLLDEPMTGLDWKMRGIVLTYLKRIWSELHTSIVIVTHSISDVLSIADDMVMMDAGNLVAQGSPSQVFSTQDLDSPHINH